MSDEHIRQILIQKKRRQRRIANIKAIAEFAGTILAWAGLFFICFMLSVIGG